MAHDLQLTRRKWLSVPAFVAAAFLASGLSGCSGKTGEGATAGAIFGAGIGLLLGAARGDAGAGLAVGAAVGGASGAYEGWKQDQDDDRTRQIVEAIQESKGQVPAPADQAEAARRELTRFVGIWELEGWGQEPGGPRTDFTARVNVTVEMNYFVRLAYLDITAGGEPQDVWGETMVGYDPSVGYQLTTHFNTLPQTAQMTGRFDGATESFFFTDPLAQMQIRFDGPDKMVIETFMSSASIGGTQIERYELSRQ